MVKLLSQNQLLLSKLMEYYKYDRNIENILPIINGSSNVSLRIIDWFVTNYSKNKHIFYEIIDDNNKLKRFNVYQDYKLRLKSYSKKRFDPFCRWDRIQIPYKDNHIETTIGQLNFFKWAVENKVLDYLVSHYEEIERDMVTNYKIKSSKRELKMKAKKYETEDEIKIIVEFNK